MISEGFFNRNGSVMCWTPSRLSLLSVEMQNSRLWFSACVHASGHFIDGVVNCFELLCVPMTASRTPPDLPPPQVRARLHRAAPPRMRHS